jgi:outer membrane protein assembly factor BamE (lipoprotein component of BamABCDE complex)
MLTQLKVGQTREQVRFILGTPLLTDMFHADRWDYPFYLARGNGELTTAASPSTSRTTWSSVSTAATCRPKKNTSRASPVRPRTSQRDHAKERGSRLGIHPDQQISSHDN